MADTTIKARESGPYLITGDVTLTDCDGKPYPFSGTAALCRCGGSENKPFCDGTHKTNGFTATERATVPEAQ